MAWNPATYKATFVDSLAEADRFRQWLGERRDWLAMDSETSGFNLGSDHIRLWQIGDETHGWAFPWRDWGGMLKELVPRYTGRVAYHNAAFDLAFAKKEGLHIPQATCHDTMVMAHIQDPRVPIGLKPRAARHVHPAARMGENRLHELFQNSAKNGGPAWDWATVPLDHPDYWLYAALDTSLTAALADKLYPAIQPYLKVYEVEMGCIFVLRDARLAGLAIDVPYAERTKAQLVRDLDHVRGLLPFEPKDSAVKEWLTVCGRERGYGHELETWWPFRTEAGAVSLDDDALKAFEPHFPAEIPLMRKYRTNSKLVNSYFNNMLGFHVDGVLRCNIKTLGAQTGRMSITEPALQQLPRGTIVRDGFIPREGNALLLADYSQMEARMFAAQARCQPMLDAFANDEDMHSWVAAEVYHHGDQSRVSPAQRQVTKSVNYARLYGAGAATIAATAGVPVSEVEHFMALYDNRFPEVARYTHDLLGLGSRRLHSEGDAYVHTILGRRLYVEKDKLYKLLNYEIQGSGGDVLKLKLCELHAAGLGPYIRLPVHDEVVMEVPYEDVEDVRETVEAVMPEVDLFSCPLTIETDVVDRWGSHYLKPAARPLTWTGAEFAANPAVASVG